MTRDDVLAALATQMTYCRQRALEEDDDRAALQWRAYAHAYDLAREMVERIPPERLPDAYEYVLSRPLTRRERSYDRQMQRAEHDS